MSYTIVNSMAIYQGFYGLKEAPFNVTSDPNFLYLSRHHQEAYSHLAYGIQERKVFLQLTGDIGTGKTTLCRAFLNRLDHQVKTAFILNPNLSPVQLLQAIVDDLGLPSKRRTRMDLMKTLNQFLIEQSHQGGNVVLIIDEAQNLSPETLEQIRLLSNFETEKEKLFQIVLVGQPELRQKLEDHNLRQLKQRIGVRYHIQPLSEEEVGGYIHYRLSIAGSEGKVLFPRRSLHLIYRYSRGVPRLINQLCDKTLLAGYVYETFEIGPELVKRCIQELENKTV